MSKRKMFDRPQHETLTNETLEIVRDPEPLATGYKRVYTNVSAVDVTSAPTKIRFGTGGEDAPKWHEEEPTPLVNVYYHTEREHHCRQQDRGIIGYYGGTEGDELIVVWHGYDVKYEEG